MIVLGELCSRRNLIFSHRHTLEVGGLSLHFPFSLSAHPPTPGFHLLVCDAEFVLVRRDPELQMRDVNAVGTLLQGIGERARVSPEEYTADEEAKATPGACTRSS